jgi:hypothetical protein
MGVSSLTKNKLSLCLLGGVSNLICVELDDTFCGNAIDACLREEVDGGIEEGVEISFIDIIDLVWKRSLQAMSRG